MLATSGDPGIRSPESSFPRLPGWFALLLYWVDMYIVRHFLSLVGEETFLGVWKNYGDTGA